MRQVILIAHNIRSCHNVGSLLRTAEGLGVNHVYLSGYTPYPKMEQDMRLPHLVTKIHRQIHKTALGAEQTQAWSHIDDIVVLLNDLRGQGFTLAAVEQAAGATPLPKYIAPQKLALLVGREV